LNGKYIQAKKILEFIKDLSQNCIQIDLELQKVEEDLTQLSQYPKDYDQNQHIVDEIKDKLQTYSTEIKKLLGSLKDFEEFVTPEVATHLKNLELKVEQLQDRMEEYERAFKLARTVRNEYLHNIEKIHAWVNDVEEKFKSHYTEPLEYKITIHKSVQEKPTVIEWYEVAKRSGQTIIESTQDESEAFQIRQTLDETKARLEHVFKLLDDQKTIIDNVVDAWTKFMELYQIIIQWAIEKKIFVGQELKINNQQEAKAKLNEYSVSERTLRASSLSI
jgi:nesprin-1